MNLNFKFINQITCCVLLMFLAPQVLSNEESEIDRLFSLGMTQSKNNNWLEARSAFESLLQLNENLHRARVELAIVYMHLYEYELAIKQFDTVLSVTELPENVRKNIINLKVNALTSLNQKLVSKDYKDKNQNSFKGSAEVAVGYDDNVRFSFGDYFLEDDPYYDSYYVELSDGTILIIANDGYVYDMDGNPLFKNDGQYETANVNKASQFNELRLNLHHKYIINSDNSMTWNNALNIKKTNNVDLQTYSKFQIKLDSEINWKLNKTLEMSYLAHYRLLQRDSQTQVQSYGLEANLAYYNTFGKWQIGFHWMDRVYEESFIDKGLYLYIFDEVTSNTRSLSLEWSKLFLNNDLLLLAKFDYLDTNEQTQYPDIDYYDEYNNSDHTGIKYSSAVIYSITPDLKFSLSMLSLTFDYSDDYTFYDSQQDKSTAIKSKLIYQINDSFDLFFSAEKTKRKSDQYEGIKSDKTLFKAGIRLNF